jgi:error-prone DNA polymerase
MPAARKSSHLHPVSSAGDLPAGRQAGLGLEDSPAPPLDDTPDFSPTEKWHHEFEILDIALREHPVGLMRKQLRKEEVITAAQARRGRSGRRVKVAGLVIRPHRPPTKSGRTVVFLTLEDETEMLEVTVFESVYQRCGAAIFTQPMLVVTGRLDRRGHPRAPAALVAEQIRGLRLHSPAHQAAS